MEDGMKAQYTPLQLCIVGCGAITEQSYLPAFAAIPQCQVVSLIDTNTALARTLAERYHIAHWSQTIDEIPSTVEAAVVALPHTLHAPVSGALMRKGLHVFCEKPMATTAADAEAMVLQARERNVRLHIGNVRRFFWCNRRMKALIDTKELGAVVSFQIEDGFVHDWPTTSGFYFDKGLAGGGVLFDEGAHIIDLLLWWLQDYPSLVTCQHDDFGGVEAESALAFHFGKTMSGSVKLSRLMKLSNIFTLTFEHGVATYQIYSPSRISNAITIESNGKKSLLKPKHILDFLDYFKEQLEDFVHSIQTNAPSMLSADSVVPSIRLIDACYKNATPLQLPWLNQSTASNILRQGREQAFDLKKLKILVTGASGFIGGRIIERLSLEYGNVPRCLLRNFNKAARVKRFPNDIVIGDVLDYDSLMRGMAGCDVVIHCASGNTPDDALNTEINVQGTENLLRAARQNQIKRFIYLSSVEVYGQQQPSLVNEDTPARTSVYSYGNSKLEAEKLCVRAYQEHSLPVVILRLSVVYGPYAPWTVDVINRLVYRGFCQTKQFNGLCNPLYIDDCVDAIFLAICQSGVEGETFLISGGETLTWNEYFARYNEMLGMPPLKTTSMLELKFYQAIRQSWDTVFHRLKPQNSTNIVFRYNSLREQGKIPNLRTILQRGNLLKSFEIFNRQTRYSIEKARKRLGFEPQYDFSRGLAIVKKWI